MNVHIRPETSPIALCAAVIDYVQGLRGEPPTGAEVQALLEGLAVHPTFVAGALQILRTGANLDRVTNNAFALKKARADERLAFYLIAGLVHWESFRARVGMMRELRADHDPYHGARMTRDAGAMSLPPVEWDILHGAVSEAAEAFETNLGTGVNPGKMMMRAAGLTKPIFQSDVYRYATHPAVLKIASDYLGMLPILNSISLLLSTNDQTQENSSQFAHLDPIDFNIVKVFLYVNDVDADSGPFHILRADASDRVQLHYDYRYRRLSDEEMFAVAKPDELLMCVGPAGTANFADTCRGFHFGSRMAPKQRKLVMLQYVTPFSAAWPIAERNIATKYKPAAQKQAASGKLALSSRDEYLLGLVR